MGEAVHAGTAFLQPDREDDVVDFAEVTPEAAALTTPPGGRRLVPRLRGWERPHRRPDGTPLAVWEMRLALRLAAVRRRHGDAGWQVDWSDDGATCGVLDVRPLRQSMQRPPVLVTVSAEDAALAAQLCARLGEHGPAVVGADGRAELDLRVLTDAVRRVGLPTVVVTRVFGGREMIAMRARPARGLRQAATLWRARHALAALRERVVSTK